jgi:catechol 2,3-dioxygenase
MTTTGPSDVPTAANRAPVHIGAVGLIARDLRRLTDYYRVLLGLTVRERTPQLARLGVGGVTLLELRHGPDAEPDDPREAGLYHTAFLMPTRADLARWILHAGKTGVPITGASDHGVSEAIYLDDPEGNGIEVYADRPSAEWRRDGTAIFQKTEPLDVDAILGEIDAKTATYPSAPNGLRLGHIHLRVGDITKAEAFYGSLLGLDVTRRRTGAAFLSSGGYHHHVAVNVWHSDRAATRNDNRAGLYWFTFEINEPATLNAVKARLASAGATIEANRDGFASADPWGTRIRFTPVR